MRDNRRMTVARSIGLFIAAGLAEIVSGFGRGEAAGTRAMFILTGLVSIAFGVVLFAHPRIGAPTLAVIFGLFGFAYGVAQITAGIQVHHTAKAEHRVTGQAA